MAISSETIATVLQGLGQKPLADGEVWYGRFHSEPTLAAACKARLREIGVELEIVVTPNHSAVASVHDYRDNGIGKANKDWLIGWQCVQSGDDDVAVIEVFAQVIKAGAK